MNQLFLYYKGVMSLFLIDLLIIYYRLKSIRIYDNKAMYININIIIIINHNKLIESDFFIV